jgi:hypothetical protein
MLLALGTGLAFTGLAFIQGDGIAQHAVSAVAARYDRLDAPRPQPGGTTPASEACQTIAAASVPLPRTQPDS